LKVIRFLLAFYPLLVLTSAVALSPGVVRSQTPTAGADPQQRKTEAEAEVEQEEHQRILGVLPNFNTFNSQHAVALSAEQKLRLALRSALDPVTFAVAGLDAAYSQAEDDFPDYHQGALGYAKRFGAAYGDSFDGTVIGNALFPMLLRQDPRYFRQATGSFKSRLFYALSTTIRCKGDNGKWQPNYSNVLGNIAAGGISNIYYPSSDRGAGLTFQRAFTVTAEGAIGAVFVEFWPDISRRLHKKH
jgi:hypothetical protein